MGWEDLGDNGILVGYVSRSEAEARPALSVQAQAKWLTLFLNGLRPVDLTGDLNEDPLAWVGPFQQVMSRDAADVIVVRELVPKFAAFLDTFISDHPEFARFVAFRTEAELEQILLQARDTHN